jgi:hypothetical protein
MYKVNPDGSIECSTAEDALRLQRVILAENEKHVARRPLIPPRRKLVPQFITETLGKFSDLDGKTLNSDDMQRIFDTESTNGVGTKLRHVRTAFEREGFDLDTYLVPVRGEDGVPRWKVNLHNEGLPG